MPSHQLTVSAGMSAQLMLRKLVCYLIALIACVLLLLQHEVGDQVS